MKKVSLSLVFFLLLVASVSASNINMKALGDGGVPIMNFCALASGLQFSQNDCAKNGVITMPLQDGVYDFLATSDGYDPSILSSMEIRSDMNLQFHFTKSVVVDPLNPGVPLVPVPNAPDESIVFPDASKLFNTPEGMSYIDGGGRTDIGLSIVPTNGILTGDHLLVYVEDSGFGMNISDINPLQTSEVLMTFNSDYPLTPTDTGFSYIRSIDETNPSVTRTTTVSYDFSDLNYSSIDILGKEAVVHIPVPLSSLGSDGVLVLDPTITINNVANYTSMTNNITTETYPLSHVTLNDSRITLYIPFTANYTAPNISNDWSNNHFVFNVGANPLWEPNGYVGGAWNGTGNQGNILQTPSTSFNYLGGTLGQDMTAIMWVYMHDTVHNQMFLSTGNDAAGAFEFRMASNRAIEAQAGAVSLAATGTNAINQNQWTCIAYEHTTGLGTYYNQIIINGTQLRTLPTNSTILTYLNTVAQRIVIGARANTGTNQNVNASIDEILMFNATLSLDEISQYCNLTYPRFKGLPATQEFQNFSIGQDGTITQVNITTNTTILNGSLISLILEEFNAGGVNTANSTPVVLNGLNQLNPFTISSLTQNVSLFFNFTPNPKNAYSSILEDTIIISSSFINTSTPQLAPSINFSAINLTSGLPLLSFCVLGTGTNTTINLCTTNGTIFSNTTGTYNYTANASGLLNQTALNIVFNHNMSITFNLSNSNVAPILISVNSSVTLDNATFLMFANATDNNSDPITYFYTLFKDNLSFLSGSSGTFTQGKNTNFHNSTLSVNGSYILQVIASDGFLNSTALNATPLNITFSSTASNATNSTGTSTLTVDLSTNFLLFLIWVVLIVIGALLVSKKPLFMAFAGIYGIAYGIFIITSMNITFGIIMIIFGIFLAMAAFL